MEIIFKNSRECDIVSTIIKNFESKSVSEKRTDDKEFFEIINELKSAIDSFKISNVFDYIGPLHCVVCRHSWTAVIGKHANKMNCPKCKIMVSIPKEKFYNKE